MNNSNPEQKDLYPKLKHYLKTLNLFKSYPPSSEQHDLNNELISTRCYIFLLIISLIALILYRSLIPTTTTNQFNSLYNENSQTLTCLCSTVSIAYGTLT
ncbi:unnamed protein product [Didymodactylos carnosus]|uniref:Uncharacterized protein n=1 Tax=Didymodactylos carnosus TaxID=1234261 RepID=A0A815TJN7_9BILA|nr:unnamed protein product [Didymodactylos carnosus]CAF1512226.1 unnamed protein product [Didymodactylos carnosus]CAF4299925.1 unnamed protein product [Didymodactylos carnosus]CAF4368141.1 unnamed protein product [Didymodactylos carnosus]